MDNVPKLAIASIDRIGQDRWTSACDHVVKLGATYISTDTVYDVNMETFIIINLADNSDTEDSSDSASDTAS